MRFRLGAMVGFGAGYWFGTKAGRERHEQLKAITRRLRRSDAYELATDKAKTALEHGVERAKDLVGSHHTGNGHQPESLLEP